MKNISLAFWVMVSIFAVVLIACTSGDGDGNGDGGVDGGADGGGSLLGGGNEAGDPLYTVLHRDIVETKETFYWHESSSGWYTSHNDWLRRWEFSVSNTAGGCMEDPDATGEIWYYRLDARGYNRTTGSLITDENIVNMYNKISCLPYYEAACSLDHREFWTSDKILTILTLTLGDNCGNTWQNTYRLEPLQANLGMTELYDEDGFPTGCFSFDISQSTGNIVRYELAVHRTDKIFHETNPRITTEQLDWVAYDGSDPKMPGVGEQCMLGIYDTQGETSDFWARLTIWDDTGASSSVDSDHWRTE